MELEPCTSNIHKGAIALNLKKRHMSLSPHCINIYLWSCFNGTEQWIAHLLNYFVLFYWYRAKIFWILCKCSKHKNNLKFVCLKCKLSLQWREILIIYFNFFKPNSNICIFMNDPLSNIGGLIFILLRSNSVINGLTLVWDNIIRWL